MHVVAFLVGFLALMAACFVFARRVAALKQRGWAAYCWATGAVILPLSAWPNFSGDFTPLWI